MLSIVPLMLSASLVAQTPLMIVADNDGPGRRAPVVIDTAVHRQLVADLTARAKAAAESGNLESARAQYLVATGMQRELGRLGEDAVYGLVHVDYALDRNVEAATLLEEYASQALRDGDPTTSVRATTDAALLYSYAGKHKQLNAAIARLREMLADPRIAEPVRVALRKRLE